MSTIRLDEVVIRRITPAVHSCGPYCYTADAGELGLIPGAMPQKLRTTLGNGRMLYLWARGRGDEFIYRQAYGCIELIVSKH